MPGRLPPTRVLAAVSALGFLALCVAGCAVEPQGGRPRPAQAGGWDDSFRPESMRIHPLTRIIDAGDGGPMVIDAHVELFDAWGHPAKGLGTLRFELFLTGAGGIGAGPEGGIMRAEVDLSDPTLNSTRYYDSATRTYRMFLEAPRDTSGGTMRLVATFLTTDDRRLRDEYTLGVRPLPREAPGPDENAPPDGARQGGS